MRLYGVLTTLCVAVFALILDVQPANADAGTSNSPLLAQQKSKLSTSANSTLLAQVDTSPIILAKSEKKTEGSKEKSEAKSDAAEKPDQSVEKSQMIITVQAGDSLAMIAERYEVSWTRLFDANELIANPDIINPGEKIRIPEADEELPDRSSQIVAAQQAAAQSAAATTTTRSYTTAPVNSSSYYVGNGMWCTDYVHSRRPDVAIYGNAGYNWISSAAAAGKSTGSTPQAGAVAVTNGHVAYVESVNADGSYVVSEMGWNYQAGNYNQRTVKPGTFGQFIY